MKYKKFCPTFPKKPCHFFRCPNSITVFARLLLKKPCHFFRCPTSITKFCPTVPKKPCHFFVAQMLSKFFPTFQKYPKKTSSFFRCPTSTTIFTRLFRKRLLFFSFIFHQVQHLTDCSFYEYRRTCLDMNSLRAFY